MSKNTTYFEINNAKILQEHDEREIRYERDGDNEVKITVTTSRTSNGIVITTTEKEITSPDGSVKTEVSKAAVGPEIHYTEIKPQGEELPPVPDSEQTTVHYDGDDEIKTTIVVKNNPDGSVTKTTTIVTTTPDGSVSTRRKVETTSAPKLIEESQPNEKAESAKQQQQPEQDPRKAEYEKKFNITGKQYDLLTSYFDNLNKKGYISIDDLKEQLKEQVKQRKELDVDEARIQHALEAIDSDNDRQIDFDEFLNMMNLFFAHKNNIRKRILNLLENHKGAHQKEDTLSPGEAENFTSFLNRFFSRPEEEINKNSPKFDKELSYKDYVKQIGSHFESLAFLKA
jgi:hypothetical protein